MSRNFTAEVVLNSRAARDGMRDLTSSARTLNSAMGALSKTLRETQGNLTQTAALMERISKSAGNAARSMDTSAKSRISASKAAAAAINQETAAERTRSQAALTAQRNSAAAANNSRAAMYDGRETRGALAYADAQRRVAASTDAAGNSLANSRYLLYDMAATYRTLAVAALAVPAASVAVAVSYEKAFAQVIRTTQSTGYASEGLREQLKQLATQIPLSFAELSNIAMIGGQMNIASKDLGAFTETVAKFVATADGMNIESATQMFGRLQNLFNTDPTTGGVMDPDFFNKIGSAISKTADNSVTSEKAIAAMLTKMGAVGKQAGMSAQDVTALASALTSVGIQPELGSGMVTRFFGGLNVAVADGSKKIDAFAKYLGGTTAEMESLIRTDPQQLFQRMLQSLEAMDSVDGARALKEMGITATRDIRVVQALASQMHVYEQSIDDVNVAYQEGDYLNKSSAGIFSTAAANMQMFVNTLSNLGDTLGRQALPALTAALKGVIGFVNGFTQFLDAVPLAKNAITVLLSIATAAGAWFAFKAVLSLVSAAMIGFQHTIQALGAGAVTTSGAVSRMNAVMLANRAASAAATTGAVAQTTAIGSMTAATTAATASNARFSVSNTALASSSYAVSAGMTAQVAAARAQSAAMAGSAAATGAATAANVGMLAAVRGLGAGMLAMVGGPIGAAVIGLAALGTAAISANAKLADVSKQTAESFNLDVTTGLTALDRAFNEDAGSNLKADFHALGKSYKDLASEVGISFKDISDAYAQGEGAMDAMIKKLEEGKAANTNPFSWDRSKYNLTIDFLTEQKKAMLENKETQKGLDEAKRAAGVVSDDATANYAEETAEVDKLSEALEAATKSVFGLSSAKGSVTSSLAGLGEAVAANGSFDINDTAGAENVAKLQAVLQAQSQMLNAAIQSGEISGRQAASSYSQFVESLITKLGSMGGDTSAIKDLANDSVNQFAGAIAEAEASGALNYNVDVNTLSAEEKIKSFSAGMAQEFNDSEFKANIGLEGIDLTEQQVTNLFAYLKENTGASYDAVLNAITDPASSNAYYLGQYMNDIINKGNYEAVLGADTSAGAANVSNFAQWAQNILVQIQNNINSVAAQVDKAAASGDFFGVAAGATQMVGLIAERAQAQQKLNSITANGYKDVQARGKQAYGDVGKSMDQGYKKGQKAAERAGGAGKKAGSDAAKGAKDAKSAADKAGDAAKKAGEKAVKSAQNALDKLKEWDKAYRDIADYAGRVSSAFGYVEDKTLGVKQAMDDYYTAVNSAKKRLEETKKTISDLRAENKKLAAEMRVDLGDAKNSDKLSGLASRYGDKDRADQYKKEADASRASAKEKQTQINSNKKEADTLQKGLGVLKGYTQAAIDNREEVRKLQKASLDVAVAHAKAGASATKVKDETVRWTAKAKEHSRQLGYTRNDISKVTTSTKDLTTMLNKVPTSKQINIAEKRVTTLQARNETGRAVNDAKRGIGSVPGSKTTNLNARGNNIGKVNKEINNAGRTRQVTLKPKWDAAAYKRMMEQVNKLNGKTSGGSKGNQMKNRGGLIGKADRMSGFASGGLIPGKSPNNPREDNLMARVDGQGLIGIRSGEYVMRQESVDYYGKAFMSKLNKMQLPRYSAGGQIGGGAVGAGNGSGMVDLSPETIMAIARAMPDVALYADSQELARSVNKGNRTLIARGASVG